MSQLEHALIPDERIEGKIYLIRGKKVMLDRDLAILYGVTTKSLNQAVKRNVERFPSDFMFQLSEEEYKSLRSQIVTLNTGRGGKGFLPYVFTELGVAMLSSVLRSERAIRVNIQIMRAFTKLREIAIDNAELRLKLEALEKRYDEQFGVVFEAIHRLLDEKETPKNEIGFKCEELKNRRGR